MVRCYLSQNESENYVMRAFYDGCPEPKELVPLNRYEPSDIAVVFGVYKKAVPISIPRGRVIEKQKLRGLTTVIIETGYINRGAGPNHHYAVGTGGINGRADFRNRGMPPDRARKLGIELKPWRDGEHVLLCGQVPWDASVDFVNHVQWLVESASILQSITGRPIIFRPHPLAKIPNLTGCRYSTGKPIEEDLENAHCAVTFNSNSGVDAVVNGVPVFAFDKGSMVFSLAAKSWADLEYPRKPDRTQWFNDIAYAQWTPEELAQGCAWRHLDLSNTSSTTLTAQK